MKFYISILIIVFMLCVINTQSTSKNEGVSWNEKRNQWQVEFYISGKKQKSYFDNECDATQKLNKLRDKMKIPPQNPEICEISNQLKKEKKSQYKGVCWHKQIKKWRVQICLKGQKQKFGGMFRDELDAAKRVNQLCKQLGIPAQNPEISAVPNQQSQVRDKTSQYRGVSYDKQTCKWKALMYLKGKKQKFGGRFDDERDAAKRVNELCKEFGVSSQNPGMSAIPNQQYQKKERTSKYKGVYWHKQSKKWYVIYKNGQKQTYGGFMFKDELDAAKRMNQLCDELKIPRQNPQISVISNQQYEKKKNISKYKGVYWHKQRKTWYVRIYQKEQKQMYGGCFKDEFDAAKRVNELCEHFGISQQNPTILNHEYQKQEKISQYKGVTWNKQRKKWRVRIYPKEHKPKFGGYFKDELNAGKRVNQLCEELGIFPKNLAISAIPNHQYQKKEKTSQYKGVYWHKQVGKWYVFIYKKGEKRKYGGMFKYELDAAKRVNQFYQPITNFEIETNSRTQSCLCCNVLIPETKTVIQTEFEDLIKILDANNDHDALKIIKPMIAAIFYQQEIIIAEVNLQTENGESPLSIASKYGFSNVVKFLISKGAEKEHFTNEHHTPLSLAVSQNHLKVVQVLFENWISPNSHEKPYLHMLPIFNVKSREIAQLLIDNDAVTHEIYNDKNQSPLTVACQNGYRDVVEFFLDDGLEINHLDSDNKTPFFYAITNNHNDIANLLISKGAQTYY